MGLPHPLGSPPPTSYRRTVFCGHPDWRGMGETVYSTPIYILFCGHALPVRCKVMDIRLAELAPRHLESKFLRIDAEKTQFFVQKLQVRILLRGCFFFTLGYSAEQWLIAGRVFQAFGCHLLEAKNCCPTFVNSSSQRFLVWLSQNCRNYLTCCVNGYLWADGSDPIPRPCPSTPAVMNGCRSRFCPPSSVSLTG